MPPRPRSTSLVTVLNKLLSLSRQFLHLLRLHKLRPTRLMLQQRPPSLLLTPQKLMQLLLGLLLILLILLQLLLRRLPITLRVRPIQHNLLPIPPTLIWSPLRRILKLSRTRQMLRTSKSLLLRLPWRRLRGLPTRLMLLLRLLRALLIRLNLPQIQLRLMQQRLSQRLTLRQVQLVPHRVPLTPPKPTLKRLRTMWTLSSLE